MPDNQNYLGPITRIPLTVVVTETGAKTDGKLVAVMVSDLDALEAENKRLSELPRRGIGGELVWV